MEFRRCGPARTRPRAARSRRTQSARSDGSHIRPALYLANTPPAPASVVDSAADSIPHPSQPSQSSQLQEAVVVGDSHPTVPPNYAGISEMVRSDRVISNAEIELAKAKAEYFRVEADSTRLSFLERIADMDLELREFQRDTAYGVLDNQNSTQQLLDQAEASLGGLLVHEASTVDLEGLLRRLESVNTVPRPPSPSS